MTDKKKPPKWLQQAGDATFNALSDVTNPLYNWSQQNQVPVWLGDAGDAVYSGLSGLLPKGEVQPGVAEQIKLQIAMEKRKKGQKNALASNEQYNGNGG